VAREAWPVKFTTTADFRVDGSADDIRITISKDVPSGRISLAAVLPAGHVAALHRDLGAWLTETGRAWEA
jgi:hypothetical protein